MRRNGRGMDIAASYLRADYRRAPERKVGPGQRRNEVWKKKFLDRPC
jgi:hypothetical protein